LTKTAGGKWGVDMEMTKFHAMEKEQEERKKAGKNFTLFVKLDTERKEPGLFTLCGKLD
jgi:hypothetical protein